MPCNDLLYSEEFIIEELPKFKDSLLSHHSSFPAEVQTMLAHIHEHLFDREITVKAVKKACNFPNNNVVSLFKHYAGVGPREYIARLKLQAAAYILQNGEVNIYVLACALGYTEEAFSRLFKKYFCCTPLHYHMQHFKTNGQDK